jgi:hypothetical protein
MALEFFETVHNYYERLVMEEIRDHYLDKGLTDEQLADMACIALNRLPPRYIRHDIDMSFYLSGEEYEEIHDKVKAAVAEAFKKLRDNPRA